MNVYMSSKEPGCDTGCPRCYDKPLMQSRSSQHQEYTSLPHPIVVLRLDNCTPFWLVRLHVAFFLCSSSSSPTLHDSSAPCTGYWWLLQSNEVTATCLLCCKWLCALETPSKQPSQTIHPSSMTGEQLATPLPQEGLSCRSREYQMLAVQAPSTMKQAHH